VEEYAKKLEKYEEEKRAKAAKFNVKAVVEDAKKIREVEVEGFGTVEYGVLTLEDSLELAKCKTAEERSVMTLWLMLRKADPTLTLEDVKAIPLTAAAKILAAISGNVDFLPKT
jgi:translation elongation factor EF-Tu-like GTPase